jgi:hypothetical protein
MPMNAANWKMVLICLFWCLWKERNNRCFEDLERSLEDILASFFQILASNDGFYGSGRFHDAFELFMGLMSLAHCSGGE